MQKFKKLNPENVSTVDELMAKKFPEYKGHSGNENGYVFNFDEAVNELEVDTFLNSISDESLSFQKQKFSKVSKLYSEMVKEVYDEMEKVFGTRNDVSAAATAATYEAMLKRPENYLAAGFKDAAAVLAYANENIAHADAYAIFRLARIAKFNADKAAALNAK